jgi:hypothetical protein
MIDYTVASAREFRPRLTASQAQGFRRHRGHMTNVIAMCVRHSLLHAHLPDYRR